MIDLSNYVKVRRKLQNLSNAALRSRIRAIPAIKHGREEAGARCKRIGIPLSATDEWFIAERIYELLGKIVRATISEKERREYDTLCVIRVLLMTPRAMRRLARH